MSFRTDTIYAEEEPEENQTLKKFGISEFQQNKKYISDFDREIKNISSDRRSITKDTYAFVPILDMTTCWTDTMLYKRYALTKAEIEFIESKISPMELKNE